MATVIQTPSVKKGMRRELTRMPVEPDCCGTGDRSPAQADTAVEPQAETFDPVYVEQLNNERMQAISRARELEEQLQILQRDREQWREEAREKGYETGVAQAQAQAAEKLDAEWRGIHALAGNLAQQQTTLLQESEDAAIEIAYAALVKILGRSRTDISLVTAMAKQAIQQISVRDGLVIHLSPDDYERFQQHLAAGRPAWPAEVSCVADDTVTHGGCIVKSRAGVLDARLDYQLQRLKALFVKTRHRGPEKEEST